MYDQSTAVAREFVRQYYEALTKEPSKAFRFYSTGAKLIHDDPVASAAGADDGPAAGSSAPPVVCGREVSEH